jgi:murein DD-endopeptidase MepM/ murein hydrolase activator NlpD
MSADMGRHMAKRRLRCTFFWGLLSAVAIGAAGCSGDMSRFGENRNANSYARAPANQPSAVPIQPPRAAVESQPLPPVQSTYSPYGPQPQYAALQYEQQPQYAPFASQPVPPQSVPPPYAPPAPQYAPPQYAPPAPRSTPDFTGAAGTGAKLAHAAAPRAPMSAPIPPVPATVARAPAAMPTSVGGSSAQTLLPTPPVYTVASGDTLGRVARRYRVSVREIAVANGIAPEAPLKVGTPLTIPVRLVATPPSAQSGRQQSGALMVAQAKPIMAPLANTPVAAAPGKLASAEPAANVRLASPVETSSEGAGPNGAPAFRWPARGRIVNNFGAKVNGSPNDGIDLAVPEGTQVRAADDGVVAYAGNELKGYGNLVLVRHSNGFVTAYANGSELLVKRNDQVHKGQVILKSGQTGNAASPQLHFEIRKNSAPVDPMQFLPADKTASAPL